MPVKMPATLSSVSTAPLLSVMPFVPPKLSVAPAPTVAAILSVTAEPAGAALMIVPGAMPGPVTAMPWNRPVMFARFRVREFTVAAPDCAICVANVSPPFAPLRMVVPPFNVVAPKYAPLPVSPRTPVPL